MVYTDYYIIMYKCFFDLKIFSKPIIKTKKAGVDINITIIIYLKSVL